jgi:hypothetical protein
MPFSSGSHIRCLCVYMDSKQWDDIDSYLSLGKDSGKAFHEYRAKLLRLGRKLAKEDVHLRLEPLDAI